MPPDMSKIRPVLLCGGVGSALYPLSTPKLPKPFLRLVSDHTMLQETLIRTRGMKPPHIICNIHHVDIVKSQCGEVDIVDMSVMPEKVRRNTGPAVANAARYFQSKSDEILLLLPCDHVIKEVETYQCILSQASHDAALDHSLLLFGATANSCETGYGYIETDSKDSKRTQKIRAFHEKPDAKTALKYIQKGYYWNTGMIMARADILYQTIQKCAPELFNETSNIAFDYAVLEKAKNLSLMPLVVGWSDIGTHARLQHILDAKKA